MATEDDLEQCFLDNVLNSLYDFGDGPKKSKANKKKKRKRCQEEEEDEEKEEMEVAATSYEGCDNEKPVKDRLDGGQHKEKTGSNSSTAERTDPPCQQKSQVEVITFQDPQKTARARRTPAVPPKKTAPAVMETEGDVTKDDGLSLEKSRFEVHRFGLTGYRKEQQRGFEVERAIMLGARPPKKEYVNYKQYQQTIKDRKQKVREQESTELRRNKKASKPREEEKKKRRSGAAPSGLAGRFRNGMLVLNSKEIQKIKGARGSR